MVKIYVKLVKVPTHELDIWYMYNQMNVISVIWDKITRQSMDNSLLLLSRCFKVQPNK